MNVNTTTIKKTTMDKLRSSSSTVRLALRGTQALFAVIVLGLAGYVAHWWTNSWHSSSPSEINFLIFTALWTLLVLIYLFIAEMTRFTETAWAHPRALVAVDALTMLFWFAGFIAVAVFVHNRTCLGGVCKAARAAAVFGAFEWLLFAITTVLSAMRLRGRTTTTNNQGAAV